MSCCFAWESCSRSFSPLCLLWANWFWRFSICWLCWLSYCLASCSLCSVSSLLSLFRFLKSSLACLIYNSCYLIVALRCYSVLCAFSLNSLSSIWAWSMTSSLESNLWQSAVRTSFSSLSPSIACCYSLSLNSSSMICSSRSLALS